MLHSNSSYSTWTYDKFFHILFEMFCKCMRWLFDHLYFVLSSATATSRVMTKKNPWMPNRRPHAVLNVSEFRFILKQFRLLYFQAVIPICLETVNYTFKSCLL